MPCLLQSGRKCREKEEEAEAQQDATRKKNEDKENKKKVKTGQKTQQRKTKLASSTPPKKGSQSPTAAQRNVGIKNGVTECPGNEKADDAPCLYCAEYFSQSKGGESWIQCSMCACSGHESCAGTSSETSFMCELCGNK